MNFQLYLPTKIHFGQESLAQLVLDIESGGYKKIALVYDHNLSGHPLLVELQNNLSDKNLKVLAKPVDVAEPTYAFLDTYREAFMGSSVQVVIGVGGGSTLDTAKAVAVLVNNKESAITYRGFDKMTEPVLPVYACPTTAGTGSEITPNASFVDSVARKKLGINGEAIRPKAAYLHPGFIMTCPQKPATYAAIDALVHAIEAFAAKKCTPPARMLAVTAVNLLVKNLVPAVKEKKPTAVEEVFWASLLAGAAMMHSGTGPTAAFSYPLGVHAKTPHGLAGAVFLLQVMEWNVSKGYHGYGELLGSELTSHIPEENTLKLLEILRDIWQQLEIPKNAAATGFKKEDLDLYLADLRELRGAIDQNPVPMQEDDLRELLQASL